jgi:hypothetical protein
MDIASRTSTGLVGPQITAAVVIQVSESHEFGEIGPESLVVIELGQLGNPLAPEGTRTVFVENSQDQLLSVS